MNLEDQLQLFQNTVIFRDLPEPTLLEIARQSRAKNFKIGETVYFEGDVVSSVFIVSNGYFKTFSSSADGSRELTLSIAGSRQMLGFVAAFLSPKTHAASCAALEHGVLICIPLEVIEAILNRSPVFSEAVIGFLANRHASLIQKTQNLFFTELNQRLASYLITHSSSEGFLLPSNSELASQLGTVPELVSRKLGEFYRQGFIRLEKRRVWLKDLESLKLYLG